MPFSQASCGKLAHELAQKLMCATGMASRRKNADGEDDPAGGDFVPEDPRRDFAPDLAVWAPEFFLVTLEVISSEVNTQRLRPRCEWTCLEKREKRD